MYLSGKIYSCLAQETKLPLEWVQKQLYRDDAILNRMTHKNPKISVADWINDWCLSHKQKSIPSRIRNAMVTLFEAYTRYLIRAKVTLLSSPPSELPIKKPVPQVASQSPSSYVQDCAKKMVSRHRAR